LRWDARRDCRIGLSSNNTELLDLQTFSGTRVASLVQFFDSAPIAGVMARTS
jgi:hypothetical protein